MAEGGAGLKENMGIMKKKVSSLQKENDRNIEIEHEAEQKTPGFHQIPGGAYYEGICLRAHRQRPAARSRLPVLNSRAFFSSWVSSAMSELEDFPPPRGPQLADPARIQQDLLEEQVELWWFNEPRKSLLCYCASVALILGCGLGGVGLLSTTTSLSSEWRLGAGTALCLLALAVLLKQLLSSAVQDMNCVRSRRRIDMLKSGGLSDVLVVLVTGLALLVCGAVLLDVALAYHMPKPGWALNDMFISGVALLAGGGFTVLAVGMYSAVVFLLERTRPEQSLRDRVAEVFTVSGHMRPRRETTSSLAQLI
ncbi:hypothetical protein P4O66_009718 [Electrophorus voltai]|uniref:Transmembrane protein 125 n=1 Tax=Electrophorus voltai TaxID=2609070 RepID=A0AAD8ZBR8_9TELE|nr:hypothetical protein P4O66_009718 [Electrophorus voltai]